MKDKIAALSYQIGSLSIDQVKELDNVFIDVSLAYELGTDWRSIFRAYKHKYKAGLLHRLYKQLEKISQQEVENLVASLTTHDKGVT